MIPNPSANTPVWVDWAFLFFALTNTSCVTTTRRTTKDGRDDEWNLDTAALLASFIFLRYPYFLYAARETREVMTFLYLLSNSLPLEQKNKAFGWHIIQIENMGHSFTKWGHLTPKKDLETLVLTFYQIPVPTDDPGHNARSEMPGCSACIF